MLSILYYFIKIIHLIGLIFGFFGLVIGLIKGHSIAMETIDSYNFRYGNFRSGNFKYYNFKSYNFKSYNFKSMYIKPFYINYNFIVGYINQISYSSILLGIIFYFIGIVIPIGILIYVIRNIYLYLNKIVR